MAKFCRYCGKPVSEGAKFCKSCGKPLVKNTVQPLKAQVVQPQAQPQRTQVVQPQAQPQMTPVVMPQAQSQRPQVAQPQVQPQKLQVAQQQAQPQKPQVAQQQAQPQKTQAAQSQVQPKVNQAVNRTAVQNAVQLAGVVDAPAGKGMFSYDMEFVNGAGSISQNIMSPVRSVLSVFPRIISGFKNVKKNPLALIALIIMPIIWILLFILRRTGNDDNIFVKILSWLSYGGDTGDRTLAGVTGSAIGRGTVALAYSSLLTGGIGRLRSGIKSLFSRQPGQAAASGKGLAVAWLLTGAGTGLIINRFIAGVPSWSGVMAVIATMFVSLQACGNSSGYLYSIARSLTSRVAIPGGAKTEDKNSIRMLLMGFIAGFACMIPYSAGNSIIALITEGMGVGVLSWLPLIIGIILLIVGMILVLTGTKRPNKQVVQQ